MSIKLSLLKNTYMDIFKVGTKQSFVDDKC